VEAGAFYTMPKYMAELLDSKGEYTACTIVADEVPEKFHVDRLPAGRHWPALSGARDRAREWVVAGDGKTTGEPGRIRIRLYQWTPVGWGLIYDEEVECRKGVHER